MHYSTSDNFLKDQVILITGAANGIGAAVSKAYASYGATVVLLDKSIPALEEVYDEIIELTDVTPALYPLDLKGADVSDYETLITTIENDLGRLDGLVHCAASLGQLAPVEYQDPKTWIETLHINLTAAYLLTQASLPLLRKATASSIIFSTDQHQGTAYWSSYGISKAGIEALSKQLAEELENEGRVRVNCIDPGDVDTRLHESAFPGIPPTEIPKADDVVSSYLYLMSQDSSDQNGQCLKAQE